MNLSEFKSLPICRRSTHLYKVINTIHHLGTVGFGLEVRKLAKLLLNVAPHLNRFRVSKKNAFKLLVAYWIAVRHTYLRDNLVDLFIGRPIVAHTTD